MRRRSRSSAVMALFLALSCASMAATTIPITIGFAPVCASVSASSASLASSLLRRELTVWSFLSSLSALKSESLVSAVSNSGMSTLSGLCRSALMPSACSTRAKRSAVMAAPSDGCASIISRIARRSVHDGSTFRTSAENVAKSRRPSRCLSAARKSCSSVSWKRCVSLTHSSRTRSRREGSASLRSNLPLRWNVSASCSSRAKMLSCCSAATELKMSPMTTSARMSATHAGSPSSDPRSGPTVHASVFDRAFR
mmetsp:Transcript_5847/g.19898  ORF Transcript_5847/g.19898 Transcript_5847/m.19898 type:complete len:254 (-) Transcript_5847:1889-2650(-)